MQFCRLPLAPWGWRTLLLFGGFAAQDFRMYFPKNESSWNAKAFDLQAIVIYLQTTQVKVPKVEVLAASRNPRPWASIMQAALALDDEGL